MRVTEPDRLIPHRLDITKSVGLNDGSGSAQLDRTTWTFQYPAAASQPPSSK